MFDERELKMIRFCIQYAQDPCGLPGHALMIIIEKLARAAEIDTD